jgi:hypothetical protein
MAKPTAASDNQQTEVDCSDRHGQDLLQRRGTRSNGATWLDEVVI